MDYKQEAEKIVEMFMPYAHGWGNSSMERNNAIQCSIKHVEGMIEELESINHKPEYVSFSYKNDIGEFQNAYERLDYYNEILNQLKQM